MTRGRLAIVRLALALALLLPGCTRPLTTEECTALVEHYTELVARARNPKLEGSEVARLRRVARARLLADPEAAECSGSVSRRAYDCAMLAPNADELEKCLLPRPY